MSWMQFLPRQEILSDWSWVDIIENKPRIHAILFGPDCGKMWASFRISNVYGEDVARVLAETVEARIEDLLTTAKGGH